MSRSTTLRNLSWGGLLLLLIMAPDTPRAEPQPVNQTPPVAQTPPSTPNTPAQRAETAPPAQDPFSRLRAVTPVDKLPPLTAVRRRGKQELQDRSGADKISISISSSPRGARVLYGGKLLGTTPLGITAPRYSTPYDVVLKRGGYMTLHARIKRLKSRSYYFKLTPAKFR